MVENMHDVPYVKSRLLGPETTASMTRVCTAVRSILPESTACGVQVMTIDGWLIAVCNKLNNP
jgi:hypothetical protein